MPGVSLRSARKTDNRGTGSSEGAGEALPGAAGLTDVEAASKTGGGKAFQHAGFRLGRPKGAKNWGFGWIPLTTGNLRNEAMSLACFYSLISLAVTVP